LERATARQAEGAEGEREAATWKAGKPEMFRLEWQLKVCTMAVGELSFPGF
jgi:hypothetical protein